MSRTCTTLAAILHCACCDPTAGWVYDLMMARAAERAGLERESLHRLLRRHGVNANAFRPSGSSDE